MDDFTSPDESLSTGKGGQWGEPRGPCGVWGVPTASHSHRLTMCS